MRRVRPAAAVVLILASLSAGLAAGQAPATRPAARFERWYSALLQDEPAGWLHSRCAEEQGRLVTLDDLALTIRRGSTTIQLQMTSRFVETLDGKAVEASVVQKQGPQEIRQTLRFTDRATELTTEGMGQKQTRTLPAPTGPEAAWLTPSRQHAHVLAAVARGDAKVEFHVVDPVLGPAPARVTMHLRGREKVEVLGKTVQALVWDVTNSRLPGTIEKTWTDEAGWPVISTVEALPGMVFRIVESERSIATRQVSPAKLPEMLSATFVRPDRPVRRPRQAVHGVYELAFEPPPGPEGKVALPTELLPRTGAQRVVWGDAVTARVVVDLTQPQGPGTDLPGSADRDPSLMIGSRDARVLELLREALQDRPADLAEAAKAEVLRQFVRRFMTVKDLSVGMASAAETARSAEGDCTEHAVLLTALLRAAGIPARAATGLIYVEDFVAGTRHMAGFGYHMWVQAWLPDAGGARWVDLDPILDSRAFDATHVALVISPLSDEGLLGSDVVALGAVIGRMKVRVIETRAADDR